MGEHTLRDIYLDSDRDVATAECSCRWLSLPQDTEDRAYKAWVAHVLYERALSDDLE